jgi:hypothetical protein
VGCSVGGVKDDAVLVEGELADRGMVSLYGGEQCGAFGLAEKLGLLHCRRIGLYLQVTAPGA